MLMSLASMLVKGDKQYHSDNAIIVLTTNIVYKQKREERKFLSLRTRNRGRTIACYRRCDFCAPDAQKHGNRH